MSNEGEEVFLENFTWDPDQWDFTSQLWGFSSSDNSDHWEPCAFDKKPESKTPINLTKGKRGSNAASKTSSPKGEGSGVPMETKVGAEQAHGIHILTERDRRKKLKDNYSNLQALLPQHRPKANKADIVDQAMVYIKSLQQTLHKLEKQKLEQVRGVSTPTSVGMVRSSGATSREVFLADQGKNWSASSSAMTLSAPQLPPCFQTWLSPNVVLNVMGGDAHINICSVKKPGLLSTIFFVMEKYKLEVVLAQLSSDHFRSMYMIHARASEVSNQFPEALMTEEIYKLAVGELLLCLSS